MTALALVLGAPQLLVGLIQGLAYGLLGLGLVLIYRSSRVYHFGYGEVGAFGALLLAKLVLDLGWSWWLAFPAVVALGAAIGAGWEFGVMRRLARAPRLVALVATIAIGQLMFAAQLAIPAIKHRDLFPTALHLRVTVGSFVVRGDHVAVIVLAPLCAAALAWFLNRTITGLAIRGASENADAASLAGVPVGRVSTVVWALGGALSTATFVLILPVRGVVFGGTAAAIGPELLLRALVVGIIARMDSLPMTVAGGVAFGVFESVLLSNVASPGTVDMVVFVALLGLLLLRGKGVSAAAEDAVLSTRLREPPLHAAGQARTISRLLLAAGAVVAVAAPFITSDPARQFTLAKIVVFAIVGISVVVVTGWAGQLSLCQFAFVGVAAFTTAGLTRAGMPFLPACAYAVAVSTVVAVVVGFPALRVRGLLLAVITLGFAVGAQGWLLPQHAFQSAPNTVVVTRSRLGPFDLTNQRTYYFVCLLALVAVAASVAALRRTGVGRSIIAVRENEHSASAATISPAQTKLMAFALSGAIAGVAGALLAGLFVNLRPADFGPEQSVLVMSMTVIGGLGSVLGAVMGALYVIGLPSLLGDSTIVSLVTSGAGLLAILLVSPGGLVDGAQRIRDALLARTAPGEPAPAEQAPQPRPARSLTGHLRPRDTAAAPDPSEPVLACRAVDVRFGGIVANRAVDLEVAHGEIVGLIGTNGAGKSTLMNAIGGYVPIQGGRITVLGHDVSQWPAHERSRLGVGRIFQDARLFPELTVRECVMVALEARARSEFLPTLLHLPPASRRERARRTVADDLLDLTGLGGHATAFVADLSTGTRRICELACLIAGGGRMILLDEPTGGVAQREVEAFGRVVLDVRRALDASMLIIEHDMPLIMSLSDRIVCMTAGEVIASGTPDEVRADPEVINAYLGLRREAIERSDAARPPATSGTSA